MTMIEWFGIGVGITVALWWWRYCVRYLTFDMCRSFDPLYIFSKRELGDIEIAFGLFGGTVLFALTPAWMVVYLPIALIRRLNTSRSGREVYLKMLGGPS